MEQIMELLKANKAELEAQREAHHKEMMAGLERLKAMASTCLEKKETSPEETEAMVESQEIPEGATGEETIGATEDRSRDLRLAVGCRGQLKTRARCDGRSQQECAAAIGQPTRCTVPAIHRGRV
jgi:hypothetical protein